MTDLEKLKEKYGDEQVLVIPVSTLEMLGLDEEGYSKVNDSTPVSELEELSFFMPRYLSDNNPQYVEIIPYVTFSVKDLYFTYKRIKNGDKRGEGKLSIGVGGHISLEDSEINPITPGMIREVKEELGIFIPPYRFQLNGIIRCKKTPFDLDHIGLHYNVDLIVDYVAEKDQLLPLGMLTIDALQSYFWDRLENWSKMILEEIGYYVKIE